MGIKIYPINWSLETILCADYQKFTSKSQAECVGWVKIFIGYGIMCNEGYLQYRKALYASWTK